MKHITIALDDKLAEDIQRYAADRRTTVDAVVREYLIGVSPDSNANDPEFRAKIRRELAELGRRTPGRLGDWKWNRNDIYAERFSRYEHPGLRSLEFGEGTGEVDKGE